VGPSRSAEKIISLVAGETDGESAVTPSFSSEALVDNEQSMANRKRHVFAMVLILVLPG
jgi:hypothetical protein